MLIIKEICFTQLRMIAWYNEVIPLKLVDFIIKRGDHNGVLFVVLGELGPNIAVVPLHRNRVHRLVSLDLRLGALSARKLYE